MSLITYIYRPDISGIIFASTGNYTLSGKAIVDDPLSIELTSSYKEVLFNLGKKLDQNKSNIPYIVGALDFDYNLISNLNYEDLKNKNFNKLIISCPVKTKVKDPIDINLLQQSMVVIEDYMHAFKLHKVVAGVPKIKASNKIVFTGNINE